MPTTETRRITPLTLWAILLTVAVLAYIIFRSTTRDLVEVRASTVDHQNMVSSISTNGKVEPIGEFQAYAPAPGVIAKVYVDVLQKVKAGDLLIKMDDSDAVAKLASANAALRTAEATLHDMEQGGSQEERITLSGDLSHAQIQQQQAQKDLAALQRLQQSGAASASEVVAAQERLDNANASLQSIQNRTTQRYSPADKARIQAQVADARASLEAAQST
jgi:HlyD family secretion protein